MISCASRWRLLLLSCGTSPPKRPRGRYPVCPIRGRGQTAYQTPGPTRSRRRFSMRWPWSKWGGGRHGHFARNQLEHDGVLAEGSPAGAGSSVDAYRHNALALGRGRDSGRVWPPSLREPRRVLAPAPRSAPALAALPMSIGHSPWSSLHAPSTRRIVLFSVGLRPQPGSTVGSWLSCRRPPCSRGTSILGTLPTTRTGPQREHVVAQWHACADRRKSRAPFSKGLRPGEGPKKPRSLSSRAQSQVSCTTTRRRWGKGVLLDVAAAFPSAEWGAHPLNIGSHRVFPPFSSAPFRRCMGRRICRRVGMNGRSMSIRLVVVRGIRQGCQLSGAVWSSARSRVTTSGPPSSPTMWPQGVPRSPRCAVHSACD